MKEKYEFSIATGSSDSAKLVYKLVEECTEIGGRRIFSLLREINEEKFEKISTYVGRMVSGTNAKVPHWTYVPYWIYYCAVNAPIVNPKYYDCDMVAVQEAEEFLRTKARECEA